MEGAGFGAPGPCAQRSCLAAAWEHRDLRCDQPSAMAAHGKLRRERGLQAEYEAQVKGERALWAWCTVESPIVCC